MSLGPVLLLVVLSLLGLTRLARLMIDRREAIVRELAQQTEQAAIAQRAEVARRKTKRRTA